MIATTILLGLIYSYLNYLIWEKTRSIPLLLIQVILYFYTFHIYWIVILHHFNIATGLEYIMDYPFMASMNEVMFISYVQYMLFALIYLLTILLWVIMPRRQDFEPAPYAINCRLLLYGGIFCFLIPVLFWLKELMWVFSSGLSGYAVYKSGADFGVLYPVLRLLFDLSAALLFLALFVAIKFTRGLKKNGGRKNLELVLSAIMLVMLYWVLMSFGDKTSLYFGLFFSLSVVLANQRKLNIKRILPFVVFVVLINTISILRHNPVGLSIIDLVTVSAKHMIFHGEAVSGLSQYILLNNNVAFYGGKSALFLLNILLPRFLYPYRLEDPYEYFAFQSDLPSGTGWGIHYATDWYMNFGIVGMLLGAIFLGLFSAYLYNKSKFSTRWLFVFGGFIASYPLSFRAGIAGIKNMALGMVLGLIVYYIACRKIIVR